jgi:crotonobetainyl-CoA:carnitine CoA-transferase CaiB-like acyl-CoA transferase
MRPLPLEGVRVVDFTRLYPGPLCSLILSDMGAEVIKIESPGSHGGDMMRTMGSGMFQALNRGKKSITLDMKNEKDQKLLHSLLETSDVLLESFRPKILEKFLNVKEMKEIQEKYEKCRNICDLIFSDCC